VGAALGIGADPHPSKLSGTFCRTTTGATGDEQAKSANDSRIDNRQARIGRMFNLAFLIGENGSPFCGKGGIGFQGRDRLGCIGTFGRLGLRRDGRCVLRSDSGVMGVEPDADRQNNRNNRNADARDLADRGGDEAPKRDHNLHQCQNSTPSFRPFSSAYWQ
jgi:hypothetical protein